ncbi:MAG: AcrR family transcriptional regulator [Oceanicoccus sp.]|jgi:AcrR family transcriptional regulator
MTKSTVKTKPEEITQPAAKSVKRPKRKEKGWQAEKSTITRTAILDATIQCLLELGYASTTTALIANYANVSRGAMMYHFTSRLAVMRAVVDYLHLLRLREYRSLMTDIDDPQRKLTRQVIQRSVEAAWEYVSLPSFLAYQELLAASRTDDELRHVIEPVEKDFEKQFLDTVKAVFPHWQNSERLEAAHDMVQFLVKGMALSHMSVRKKSRTKHVINNLTTTLYNIYEEANLTD